MTQQFAKLSELRVNDFIATDGGFQCIEKGEVVRVMEDRDGLFFVCKNGRHYLEGQTIWDENKDDTVIGVYKVMESVRIVDPINLPPVITGEHGRAWLCDNVVGQKELGVSQEEDACLAHWVIEAPWANPVWHSYSLLLIHLRPVPGMPLTFHLNDATHEMWLFAIDPTKDRTRLLRNGIVDHHWLSPINYASQFIEISDELAVARIRSTVQMICDGRLSPDTDFRSEWVKLFGDNMLK